jgi:hypothetical protein
LEWSATFEPDGLPESEAAALLEGALAVNSLALEEILERDAVGQESTTPAQPSDGQPATGGRVSGP